MVKIETNQIPIAVAGVAIVVVIIGVVFYFVSHRSSSIQSQDQSLSASAASQLRAEAGTKVSGKVISLSGKTVIVDVSDNKGQRIVQISGSTSISRSLLSIRDTVITQGAGILLSGKFSGTTLAAESVTLDPTSKGQTPTGSPRPSVKMRKGTGDGSKAGFEERENPERTVNSLSATITKIDGNTVTATSFDNRTYTITFTETTTYKKLETRSLADIVAGSKVTAYGIVDGSDVLAADRITIE